VQQRRRAVRQCRLPQGEQCFDQRAITTPVGMGQIVKNVYQIDLRTSSGTKTVEVANQSSADALMAVAEGIRLKVLRPEAAAPARLTRARAGR
jgi:hypothetical protein